MNIKYFRVGDPVTCLIYGRGTVQKVYDSDDASEYSIMVTFGDIPYVEIPSVTVNDINIQTYTFDGRYQVNGQVTLFQGHYDFTRILPLNQPIDHSDINHGDLVWVSNDQINWFLYFYNKGPVQLQFGGNVINNNLTPPFSFIQKYENCPFKQNDNP